MRMLAVGLALACLDGMLAELAAAASPSFDCAKAEGEIEQLICQDEELARLDRELGRVFGSAEKQPLSAGQLSELLATQRGWIKGRNDCWKADDKRQCAVEEYTRRTVFLQARYGTATVGKSVYFTCDGPQPNEIIFTPAETDPPSANLVRGNEVQTVMLAPAASGAKYEGDFGLVFWSKGDEAQVNWPQGTSFTCKVKR